MYFISKQMKSPWLFSDRCEILNHSLFCTPPSLEKLDSMWSKFQEDDNLSLRADYMRRTLHVKETSQDRKEKQITMSQGSNFLSYLTTSGRCESYSWWWSDFFPGIFCLLCWLRISYLPLLTFLRRIKWVKSFFSPIGKTLRPLFEDYKLRLKTGKGQQSCSESNIQIKQSNILGRFSFLFLARKMMQIFFRLLLPSAYKQASTVRVNKQPSLLI